MAAAVVATTQVKAAQERARNQPTEEERAEAAEAAATAKAEKDVYDLANPIRHLIEQFFDIINGNGLQTLLYLLFVIIFQSLLNTTRIPEEYYLDKVRALWYPPALPMDLATPLLNMAPLSPLAGRPSLSIALSTAVSLV